MSFKQDNFEIVNQNSNNLRELEQMYTNNKVDTMLVNINAQKDKITNDIIKFSEEHKRESKWDKEGNVIEYKSIVNPLVINNYFFKPIINLSSQEPEYNAEKLALVYDYYCYILAEVNDKIGNFPSSLTSFCMLAGITTNTLRSYRNSADLNMRTIVEKIYDQIGDVNVTMGQLGVVSEKMTIFKLKTQNEIIEKQQPTVHISITEKPDMERIEQRLNKYKLFADKKRIK